MHLEGQGIERIELYGACQVLNGHSRLAAKKSYPAAP
jgi:hypothetical protein